MNMNARMKRKQRRIVQQRAADPDILIRLEAKTDLILDRYDNMERRSALIGAISGGIAGGIVSVGIAYARAIFGVR